MPQGTFSCCLTKVDGFYLVLVGTEDNKESTRKIDGFKDIRQERLVNEWLQLGMSVPLNY